MRVSQRSFYLRQTQRYDEFLRKLDRLPEQDPCEDGETIKFVLRMPTLITSMSCTCPNCFRDAETEYVYSAVRAGGRYYTTSVATTNSGRDKRVMTWSELVNWVLLTEGVTLVSMHKMRVGKKLTVGE